MKKRSAKLTLYRETLRHLVTPEASGMPREASAP